MGSMLAVVYYAHTTDPVVAEMVFAMLWRVCCLWVLFMSARSILRGHAWRAFGASHATLFHAVIHYQQGATGAEELANAMQRSLSAWVFLRRVDSTAEPPLDWSHMMDWCEYGAGLKLR